ncbi:hypothetical protein BDV93DRAFT_524358 [Ceratobasidium sp. AG-I]|nr:hypothetical protein BDV93DRAFT_524358 [Ceratobasidium sp. AG-I]
MTSRRSPAARYKDIFPPGFDSRFERSTSSCSFTSTSCRRAHFTSTPEQLYHSLVERYDPKTPVESIIVKSAWYGKQTRSAHHEFLVIHVEDIMIPELSNYLVLERNAESNQGFSKTASLVSSDTTIAKDTFQVAYDGDIDKLLKECKLKPFDYLEGLTFKSNAPLRLYELITLADIVSKRHPVYRVVDSSCYLYAAVIWDCMRRMRPEAAVSGGPVKNKGRCYGFRFIPDAPVVQDIYEANQLKLQTIELRFRQTRMDSNVEEVVEDYGQPGLQHIISPPSLQCRYPRLGTLTTRGAALRFSIIQLGRSMVNSMY